MTGTGISLVTGASGFVGRPLCRRLAQSGGRVHALLRREVEGPWDAVFRCELGVDRVPAAALGGVDAVYHLAGIVHAMPGAGVDAAYYRAVNTEASEELAARAAQAGVKQFIYFSTVKAVADPGDECVDESWQRPAEDPYGCSKHEAEQRLFSIGRESSMQVTVLRPALVYGAGVKGNLLRMLQAIDRGRFPPLPDTGNRRSMVNVDDLVDAALLVAASPRASGQVYIVSDNAHYSTRQLYEWMSAALGRDIAHWSIPVPALRTGAWLGDAVGRVTGRSVPLDSAVLQRLLGSACYRSERIQAQLGWRPYRHLRDCLPEMVREYRAESGT